MCAGVCVREHMVSETRNWMKLNVCSYVWCFCVFGVCTCVCVCVRERERANGVTDSKYDAKTSCVYVRVVFVCVLCVCECVCVCVRVSAWRQRL